MQTIPPQELAIEDITNSNSRTRPRLRHAVTLHYKCEPHMVQNTAPAKTFPPHSWQKCVAPDNA